MLIYAAIISHRHGTNLYLAQSEADVRRQIADYCAEWWDEARAYDDSLPTDPETSDDAISSYFDSGIEEWVEFFDPQAVNSDTIEKGGAES